MATAPAKRDPAKVTRYQEAAKRIQTLQPGTPEYQKNADTLKSIGGEYGFNWQNDLGAQPGAASGAATAPPSVTGPSPAPTIPDTFKSPSEAFKSEADVANYGAGVQAKLNNPNITTPFGSSSTSFNPDGSVNVDQKLAPDQQGIVDRDTKLSQMGRDIAQQRLSQGGYGQAWNPDLGTRSNDGSGLGNTFNPNLTARTTTGDVVADRRRIEDQVFQNLTRNLGRNKDEEQKQVEQTLYNRGIPLDPNNPIYQKTMRDLNERYDQREADARGQAVQMGGDEYGRSVGIQETLRSNDYATQSGTRGIQFGENQQGFANQEGMRSTDFGQGLAGRQQGWAETSGLAGFGAGATMPNLPGYQAPTYQLPSPTGVYGTIAGVQQGQEGINLQKKQLAIQAGLAAMKGGGGGDGRSSGQSSAQKAPNPFNGL